MPGRYYTTDFISQRQARTPEGFLVLYDVQLARTGEQLYHESELAGWGIKGDRAGVVTVSRLAADVFEPDAIASFEAKDVSDDHPFDGTLITPDTYRRDSVGVVVNVRRSNDDFLVGDIIVKHGPAIQAIADGKRQVSCGYTCDYTQTGPGTARQYNIRGNHVALVDVGRCGDQCAIGDHAMPAPSKLRALKARALAALATKDEATLKKVVDEMPDEGEDDEGASNRAGDIHVHNHITAPGATGGDSKEGDKMPTKDEDKEERMKKLEEDSASMKKALDGIKSTVDSIAKRIAKDEGKVVEGVEIPPAGEQGVEGMGSTDAKRDDESDDDYKKRMEDRKGRRTGDARHVVRDSAHLVEDFEQAVADADLLVPGIRVSTFDAKAPAKATLDALCALRRRALGTAYQTEDGAEIIDKVLPREYRGKPNVFAAGTMDCASVSAVFAGAVAMRSHVNNDKQRGMPGYKAGTYDNFAGAAKAPTIAELQKMNDDYWNKNKA